MPMTQEMPCVGFIQLVFFDSASKEVICLGGAGFVTLEEDAAAWDDVSEFQGQSNFMADRMDSKRNIVDDKWVSAETCERLLGKPIATLIQEGRAKLAADLAELRREPLAAAAVAQ